MGTRVYFENFSSVDSIAGAYAGDGISKQDIVKVLDDAKIWVAWYGYGDYCGNSFVLYEVNGTLYEVNGSHCSCYGLEGQWKPEKTSWKVLHHILENGTKFADGSYAGGIYAENALRSLVKRKMNAKD